MLALTYFTCNLPELGLGMALKSELHEHIQHGTTRIT